ncbi:hypothetical protein GCM10028794_18280 [Silanimonas algicola]
MRLIRILLAFLCIAFGIGVVALNGSAVLLDLLWVEFSLPLGLLLLSVLLLGALLGGLAALLSRTASTPVVPSKDDDEAAA